MAGKTKFERKVFKDLIRDAIYEAIVNEELKPGDRIVEMEWAERFSASQAPVRGDSRSGSHGNSRFYSV